MQRANSQQASQFRLEYKGHNFMTPNLIGLYVKGKYIIEFSQGGFRGDLFGVTVFPRSAKLNKCFKSEQEAREYIESLSEVSYVEIE